MATTLEIIRGISQALVYSYDGAHDARYTDDGEAHTIGLKREEGDPILDSRVMDGFKVKFAGNKLCIHYHSEVKLKDVHDKNFESDTEGMINKIAKFLKKEYKKVTGDTLTLTADGEMEAIVQNTSRVRSWVQAYKWYKIGGIGDVEPVSEASEERLEDSFKKWLELGKKSPKPKNVTRKKD
tara:strand:+ start:431 stop:976 length:546 start_codon:yes stop_codon:yes gene_type:complete